jgi:2-dehydropantoate 2-reductase
MDFVIVGAGALGSILGAQLLEAGHSVVMLARGGRAEALRRDGIRLHGLVERQTACPVETDPGAIKTADVVILAVKTLTHEAAAQSLAHLQVDMVLSVANGVLKNQQLIGAFGEAHVLGCMADVSGELQADGRVLFTRNMSLQIGELHKPSSDRCEALVSALNASGMNAAVAADIRSVEWSKFVGWCPFMGLSVLSRAVSAEFLSDPDHAAVMVAAVREMHRLATALGIEIEDRSPLPVTSIATGTVAEGVACVLQVGARIREHSPEHRMSALQDLLRGTPLEVEATLGHAVVLGRQHDIDMPTMNALYRLVAGVDRQNRQG